MGHAYKVVQWTPFKKAYDLALIIGVTVFLGSFIAVSATTFPDGQNLHPVQLVMRATGASAFALLHLVLAIGPLTRLSPRFKPLLYNRRHMGVVTFLLALIHAGLVLMWYHGFSDTNVFVSLFASNPRYGSLNGFPFESLGFAALVILFLMASTSHDFWNANLGPRVWKTLHMSVYAAYGLLTAHVVLGIVQAEKSPLYGAVVALGLVTLASLHLATGLRERMRDTTLGRAPEDGWLRVGPARDIPENRAFIVVLKDGERVAVFRYDDKVSAVSNVCRHQAGPLGEGCILDGLVTCPWHGFQYRPEDGCAPPPFTEKIHTYRVKIENGVVFVDPKALPPGTPTPPANVDPLTEAA
ncbi:MAG: ferric reductase-like transmembrane domain-containing protein [Maricaulaceae bacterium]|jgi:nitrite reductase/ring-hydroxylating ferredoxin subunit/DMSO/TMAO reductase YedYZ heme-binding membrane subunit